MKVEALENKETIPMKKIMVENIRRGYAAMMSTCEVEGIDCDGHPQPGTLLFIWSVVPDDVLVREHLI